MGLFSRESRTLAFTHVLFNGKLVVHIECEPSLLVLSFDVLVFAGQVVLELDSGCATRVLRLANIRQSV